MRRAAVVARSVALLAACRPAAAPLTTDSLRGLVAGRAWELVAGPGQPSPVGANGLPASMRFDSTGTRVAGYAGCNSYGAPFTLRGDSVRIGPVVTTKMACANDTGLESWFVQSLERVHRAEVVDDHLVLVTVQDRRLRFAPATSRPDAR